MLRLFCLSGQFTALRAIIIGNLLYFCCMSKVKLQAIIEKQIADSTAYWAGKPKLGMDELSAIDAFAKQKGSVLDEFCASNENNAALAQLLSK